MGSADYEVTRGSVTIDGDELLGLPTWQRAQRGLFLAMQYPVEVPGVPLEALVGAALDARAAATPAGLHDADRSPRPRALGVADELLARGVNDEFSGGEKKRAETVQLAVLAAEVRGARRDRLRPRRRRARATSPAASTRMTPRTSSSACSRSRTTRGCSPSCAPTACTCCWPGASSKAADPSSPTSSKRTGYEGIAAELGIDELAVEPPAAELIRSPTPSGALGRGPRGRAPVATRSSASWASSWWYGFFVVVAGLVVGVVAGGFVIGASAADWRGRGLARGRCVVVGGRCDGPT